MRENNNIHKIELFFEGIDCPNCAGKIEDLLNKNEFIIEARINFLSKKIIVTYLGEVNIIDLITVISRKIEPDAKVFKELKDHHEHDSCHDSDCHHHEHDCHHECCHDSDCHHHDTNCDHKHNKNNKFLRMIIGIVSTVIAIVLENVLNSDLKYVSKVLFIVAYVFIAWEIIIKSFKNIRRGNVFDENFLMLVASIGAIIIDENLEAILVVLLYSIGEYFQNKALGDSTASIAGLVNLKSDYVQLENGDLVDIDKVSVDSKIIVKAGEKIPLDGIIISGNTSLDAKILTGESIPKDVGVGDGVMSGCINLRNAVTIKVTKVASDSLVSKIIKMVEDASNKKSKTEEFITKFARIYTPVVLSIAVVVFLVEWLLIDAFSLNDALNNSFVFLVTSCPCALVISIPLAFYGGIGKCSSFGILVKGGNFIEALSKSKVVCFDKTGTLTKGNFALKEIIPFGDVSKDLLIDYLVSIERYSNHPIAKSILKVKNSDEFLNVEDVRELSGYGMKGNILGRVLLVGNETLMKKENINYIKKESIGSVVYVAYDYKYLGCAIVSDEIKESSYKLISELKELNISPVMITGDNENIALDVGKRLGIEEIYSNLLPHDKFNTLSNILNRKQKNEVVIYVGDGINDTPSIKLADVGIAVGAAGNDEAVEVSDVVVLDDDMDNLVKAIKVSKFTKKILKQNIIFALSCKMIALVIGIVGILGSYGMLLGVFADVGVCLIAILNTLRILKYGDKK